MLSVITVPTEIEDGIATESPAASTAHHSDRSRPREEVHRNGREREEERVHDLEPRVRTLEVRGEPEHGSQHRGVERAEAVLVPAEAQSLSFDDRGRTDDVAHLVRMDAGHVDGERQDRVEDERADHDEAEHQRRPVVLARRARMLPLGRRRVEVRRHARGDGRWLSAIGASRMTPLAATAGAFRASAAILASR